MGPGAEAIPVRFSLSELGPIAVPLSGAAAVPGPRCGTETPTVGRHPRHEAGAGAERLTAQQE